MYFLAGRETVRHNGTDYNELFFATIPNVDVFDFKAQSWTTLNEEIPIQTAAGGLRVIDNKIYYVGGEAGRLEAFTELQILILPPKRRAWAYKRGAWAYN